MPHIIITWRLVFFQAVFIFKMGELSMATLRFWLPRSESSTVRIVCMISFLNAFALTMVAPVLPTLVISMVSGAPGAARAIALLSVLFGLAQSVCTPLLGVLSDKVGRRPVLLASVAGMTLDYFIIALYPSLWILCVGRVIAGMTSASNPTLSASLTDTIPGHDRVMAFSRLSASYGFGFFVGPLFGGLCARIGPMVPFYAAAMVSSFVFFQTFVNFQETLPASEQTGKMSFFGYFKGLSLLFRGSRYFKRLLAIWIMMFMAQQVMPTTFPLFLKTSFFWSEVKIGLALSSIGLGQVLVQLVLIRKLAGALSPRALVIIGYVGTSIGMAIFATAAANFYIYIGIAFFLCAGLIRPPMQALLSQSVPETHQGRLQAVLSTLMSLSALVGPMVFGGLLSGYLDHGRSASGPAWPYVAAGVMTIAGALLARTFISVGQGGASAA